MRIRIDGGMKATIGTLAFAMCLLAALAVAAPAAVAAGAVSAPQPEDPAVSILQSESLATHLVSLKDAAISLPVATLLGAALAFRPRRRGTPQRSAAVIQTQIVLAIVGALVMLVVGASLARAFGVAGVAGLIRYRAKIDDPKDASVMLASLAVGLASGVRLYVLATFATFFVMGVLWLIESLEPHPFKTFTLKITAKAAATLQPKVEQVLRRSRATFDLRSATPDEICYNVQLPIEKRTDALSNAILKLETATAVEWEEKKKNEQSPGS